MLLRPPTSVSSSGNEALRRAPRTPPTKSWARRWSDPERACGALEPDGSDESAKEDAALGKESSRAISRQAGSDRHPPTPSGASEEFRGRRRRSTTPPPVARRISSPGRAMGSVREAEKGAAASFLGGDRGKRGDGDRGASWGDVGPPRTAPGSRMATPAYASTWGRSSSCYCMGARRGGRSARALRRADRAGWLAPRSSRGAGTRAPAVGRARERGLRSAGGSRSSASSVSEAPRTAPRIASARSWASRSSVARSEVRRGVTGLVLERKLLALEAIAAERKVHVLLG